MIPGVTAHPHKIVLAASGSRTNLEAARVKLLAAFPEGGTVQIPSGTHQFSGTWVIDERIDLQGQGMNASARLEKSDTRNGFSNPSIRVTCTGDRLKWRCRGFYFKGRSDASGSVEIAIYPHNTIDFRIYDMEWEFWGRCGVQVRGRQAPSGFAGTPQGVIYNCSFTDMFNLLDPDDFPPGYGVEIVGDENDSSEASPGSLDMVYIEDCTFRRCRHGTAGNNESRYVVRHCEMFQQGRFAHTWDQHGKYPPQFWPEGGRWVEVMHNITHSNFNNGGEGSSFTGVAVRGGGAVIFDNDLDNTISFEPYSLRIERWERLSSSERQYPVDGQTGHTAKFGAHADAYGWDNRYLGNPQELEAMDFFGGAENLVEGRDFHNTQKPGYTEGTYPHPKRALQSQV